FDPANSIEVVIWTAVGGRGTLVGPIIGAIVVNLGKSWFTTTLPELWLFALGALFIFSTLFLPKGIVGVWRQVFRPREKTSTHTAPPPATAEEINRDETLPNFGASQIKPAE